MTTLHVATDGSDSGEGSAASPLRTIDQAAQMARPGDTVLVHEGEYREWVRPRCGGLSDQRRITYQAAPGEHVVIKGSEPITGWERDLGTVWRVSVPNALFGDFNPFAELIEGDWIDYPDGAARKHLGDVYLNGRSFYEAASRAELADPPLRTKIVDRWTGTTGAVHDPEQTQYVWYAEVDQATTTIWANFQGSDPNTELVEINVRRSVFFPTEHHIDYITVRGFELSQAASPWAPPTADQPGLIGPNWAKGWIIEDNVIHDAKCSAISLGKAISTGHNYAAVRRDKSGYQCYLESVFAARQIGWDREHIGSHIIRRNTIFDCGQNAIVGHLGSVFSVIEDNHIYRIAVKREFYGYEIGGIKLHAAIDVAIRHNRIHDCTLGTWLDWQTQGTRISRNLYYRNNCDLFIEVSHGPYLAEHNIFASPVSVELASQGGAFVNNLVCGAMRIEPVLDRTTPYHIPHSTQVAGYAVIYGGDDRYIGNIFLGGDLAKAFGPAAEAVAQAGFGTAAYDGHPASFEEYMALLNAQPPGDARFLEVKQAVYVRQNVYGAGARAFKGELGAIVLDAATAAIVEDAETVYLETDLPEGFDAAAIAVVTGADLERVRLADADFEELDGSPLVLDVDLLGARRPQGRPSAAGPISGLAARTQRIAVW